VTSGCSRVDNYTDLCVPWKIEVFSYGQRVTHL